MVDVVLEAARDLTAFAQDILDLGKLELGEGLRPEELDLEALLRRVALGHEVLAQRAGIALRVEVAGPVWARADPVRLRQVVANLIQNALKFTPGGGHLTLRAATVAGGVRVEAQDNGRGIPEHLLEAVFEKYAQVPAERTEGRRGVGLGLAICKRIVEMHGGRIWAECVPGGGTCIRFVVPGVVAEPRGLAGG